MVGIIDLLAQCKLLEAEARDPQQWYKCTSPRLGDSDAAASIKALLQVDSPYFAYMNNLNPKTAEIYWTLVDPPIELEGESPTPRPTSKRSLNVNDKGHRGSSG